MKSSELIDSYIGRLHVLREDPENKIKVICECECGNIVSVYKTNLTRRHTESCGCLKEEQKGNYHFIHGGTGTRLYKIWKHMKRRCYNKNTNRHENYIDRGITVCDEWREHFEAFRDWAMANGYKDDLTLDRIDNNGNYEPSNCRWVNAQEQANNRRSNHYLEYNGERHTIAEWGRITGIKNTLIYTRIYAQGWSVEKALTTKVNRKENHGK